MPWSWGLGQSRLPALRRRNSVDRAAAERGVGAGTAGRRVGLRPDERSEVRAGRVGAVLGDSLD